MSYVAEFDGLRAVAILVVLLGHFAPSLISAAGYGVDLFFVLSGFLISKTLTHSIRGGMPFFVFYWNRFTRLCFPLFSVCVFIMLLPSFLLNTMGKIVNVSGALFYVTNWTRAFPVPGWPNYTAHTWSLSIEEQFYILWPLLLWILYKLFSDKMKWAVLAITALSFIVLGLLISLGASKDHLYNGFDGRCPAILLGACIALFLPLKIHPLLVLCSLLGFVAMSMTVPWTTYTSLLVYLFAAILISFVAASEEQCVVSHILRFKPIVFVGIISYPLYLWHWIVYCIMEKLPQLAPPAFCFIGLGATFTLAIFTTRYIEMPCRRLRTIYSVNLQNRLGMVCFASTIILFIAGILVFYSGFITQSPY